MKIVVTTNVEKNMRERVVMSWFHRVLSTCDVTGTCVVGMLHCFVRQKLTIYTVRML